MSTVDLEGRPGQSPKPGTGKGDPRYVSLRPDVLAVTQLPAYSFEIEQYRNLSLEIERRIDPEDTGSHVLAIAGPDPACGKTLTSLNLALVLARRKERNVLLVEGDLWKPSFGSIFQLQAETVGLTDLLREEKLELDDALLSVWGSGLTVLPAGQRSQSGDLITSRRMDDLLVQMKSRFNLVVFDTPPIGLASGRYLTSAADSVVIVVRARQTEKEPIREALDSLRPEAVAGLVLNDVQKRERHYAYYSSYLAYYGADRDEKPLGWSKGFWKRPLAGLAAMGAVVGTVAASIFAIVRGKPAEAPLEPAWIVAGILLILTVTSWAFLLGRRVPLENEQKLDEAGQVEPALWGSAANLDEDSVASGASPERPPEAEPFEDQEAEEIVLVAVPSLEEQGDLESASPDEGITITNLNIRRQPALDGDYLTTLPRGTSFEVLDESGDWYLVRAGLHEGWVAKLGAQVGAGVAPPTEEAASVVAEAKAQIPAEIPSGAARTNTNLNLRRLPGRMGEYLTTLPEGTSLEVLEEQDDWYNVRAGGQSGWVFKQGVAFDGPTGSSEPAASVEVGVPFGGARTGTNLNLRRQPGLTGEYIATLPAGTALEVVERRGDWYRIRAGEQAGWVFKRGVVFDVPGSASRGLPDDPLAAPDPQAEPGAASVKPKFLSWEAPSYSTTADSKGLGEVLVASVQVDATGSVLDVTLVGESRTDETFNKAVLESLRTAVFRPAFRNGVAVSTWHRVRVKYQESS